MKLVTKKEVRKILAEVHVTVPELIQRLSEQDFELKVEFPAPHPDDNGEKITDVAWIPFNGSGNDLVVWDKEKGVIRIMLDTTLENALETA